MDHVSAWHHRGVQTIGDRLSLARAYRGFGLREVARRAEVTPGALSKYESGVRPTPKGQELGRVCGVLAVRIEWVLTGTDPMTISGENAPATPAPVSLDEAVKVSPSKWNAATVAAVRAAYASGPTASLPDDATVLLDAFARALSGKGAGDRARAAAKKLSSGERAEVATATGHPASVPSATTLKKKKKAR